MKKQKTTSIEEQLLGSLSNKEGQLLRSISNGKRLKLKTGGVTQGEFSHKTNPLTVVDKEGNNTGMELTGGEGVFDKDAMKRLDVYKKQGNLKEAGKLVFAEMDSWVKNGTGQEGTQIPTDTTSQEQKIYPWPGLKDIVE